MIFKLKHKPLSIKNNHHTHKPPNDHTSLAHLRILFRSFGVDHENIKQDTRGKSLGHWAWNALYMFILLYAHVFQMIQSHYYFHVLFYWYAYIYIHRVIQLLTIRRCMMMYRCHLLYLVFPCNCCLLLFEHFTCCRNWHVWTDVDTLQSFFWMLTWSWWLQEAFLKKHKTL